MCAPDVCSESLSVVRLHLLLLGHGMSQLTLQLLDLLGLLRLLKVLVSLQLLSL